MDLFPSVMEYLKIDVKPEWDIDGLSRLQWSNLPASQLCDLSKTKPAIALSGGYIFDAHDADNIEEKSELALD